MSSESIPLAEIFCLKIDFNWKQYISVDTCSIYCTHFVESAVEREVACSGDNSKKPLSQSIWMVMPERFIKTRTDRVAPMESCPYFCGACGGEQRLCRWYEGEGELDCRLDKVWARRAEMPNRLATPLNTTPLVRIDFLQHLFQLFSQSFLSSAVAYEDGQLKHWLCAAIFQSNLSACFQAFFLTEFF